MIVELSRTQIEELHRASSKMTGARRRAFQAEIASSTAMEALDSQKPCLAGVEAPSRQG